MFIAVISSPVFETEEVIEDSARSSLVIVTSDIFTETEITT